MAGMIRGACISGGWSLSTEQRESFVARFADQLLSASFHWKKELGDPLSRARSVEARAYATAQVASTTTSGERPHVEGVRVYVREAAKLALALLAAAGAEAEAGQGDAELFTLVSADREFLTAERAAELLAPLTAPGALYSKVKLSTKSFGRDAAKVAASAFTALGGRLKEVDLSDCFAGRPEEEQKEALALLCGALTVANGVHLHSLDLSDNALGEKGVRAAAAALAGQPQLRRLALQNDGISVAAASALAELLASGHSGELRNLQLYNNMTGCEGAAHVARLLSACPQLEELRLVSSRVGEEGGAQLASCLAGLSGKALLKLDLCDNGLGEACGASLGLAVAAHPRLSVLLLNECGLCDSGIAALAQGLASHPALSRLELCCNELGPKGAQHLAQALSTLKHLSVLRVAENELGAKGAAALGAGLAHAASAGAVALTDVDFSTNELQGGAARALATHLALRRCAKLGLDGNALGARSVAAVTRLLAKGGGVLLPMEENDEEGDEDEDDAEEEEGADADDIASSLSKAAL